MAKIYRIAKLYRNVVFGYRIVVHYGSVSFTVKIYDLLLTTEVKIKVLERVIDLGMGKTTENG